MVVEPCCHHKQLSAVFESAQLHGGCSYVTYSDTTIVHLLNWLTSYMPMSRLTLCMPSLHASTLHALKELCRKSYYDSVSHEQRPLVAELNLIAQDYPEESSDWFSGSLTPVRIIRYSVGFRAILISTDYGVRVEKGHSVKTEGRRFVVQGSLNQFVVRSMQMVTVTSGQDYSETYSHLSPIIKLHKIYEL